MDSDKEGKPLKQNGGLPLAVSIRRCSIPGEKGLQFNKTTSVGDLWKRPK